MLQAAPDRLCCAKRIMRAPTLASTAFATALATVVAFVTLPAQADSLETAGGLSLTLATPEPTVMAGTAAAFAMLGLCHGLVRRRRSL